MSYPKLNIATAFIALFLLVGCEDEGQEISSITSPAYACHRALGKSLISQPSSKACNHKQNVTADVYGLYPQDYKTQIKKYMRDTLTDSDSAKYEQFSIPRKLQLSVEVATSAVTLFGYLICVDINAKNRYGGYTGFKTHYVYLENVEFTGNVIASAGNNFISNAMEDMTWGNSRVFINSLQDSCVYKQDNE